MANHQFIGFTVKERVQLEDAIHSANKYLPIIVKDARANTSDLATRAYRLYFGAHSTSRQETVIGILSCMEFVLSAGRITFRKKTTGDYRLGGDTCASTKPPYGVWSDQTPKQMAYSSHTHPDAYQMNIGCSFYDATNSLDHTVKSAQFNSFTHELSHLVGDTLDPVYGSIQARALAIENPDSAVRCAENYGFYCEMFYQEL